jgi:hypothetical protein
MNHASKTPPSRAHARAFLIGLLLVFVAPLVIAAALYYFSDRLPLPGPASHGDLILPAHSFQQFDLTRLSGGALDIGFLRGRWTLVYIGGSVCDLWCEASLFKMRQVRLALGRDQGRVQRLYVLTDTHELARLRPILGRHPGMTVAEPRAPSRRALLSAFGAHPSGTFFLVDPHANLMMRYPPDATSEGLKEDLAHLLEVSTIG